MASIKEQYTTVELSDDGLKSLKLNKTRNTTSVFGELNKNPRFKTDKITMPFGASINKFKTQGPKEYYIDCNITEELKMKLDVLSNKLVDLIYKNQGLFMNETFDLETIKSRWTNPVKVDSYSSKIKVKIGRTKSGGLDVNVFDSNLGETSKEQYVYIDDSNILKVLESKRSCGMLLRFGSVYYFREKFGVTFILSQIKLMENEKRQESDGSDESVESGILEESMMDDF
jgi:hypothetical protein